MKVLKSLFVQSNLASPSFRNDLSLNEAEKMIASKQEAEMSTSCSTQVLPSYLEL